MVAITRRRTLTPTSLPVGEGLLAAELRRESGGLKRVVVLNKCRERMAELAESCAIDAPWAQGFLRHLNAAFASHVVFGGAPELGKLDRYKRSNPRLSIAREVVDGEHPLTQCDVPAAPFKLRHHGSYPILKSACVEDCLLSPHIAVWGYGITICQFDLFKLEGLSGVRLQASRDKRSPLYRNGLNRPRRAWCAAAVVDDCGGAVLGNNGPQRFLDIHDSPYLWPWS